MVRTRAISDRLRTFKFPSDEGKHWHILSLLSILRRFKNFSTNFGIRISPFVPFDYPLALSETNKTERVSIPLTISLVVPPFLPPKQPSPALSKFRHEQILWIKKKPSQINKTAQLLDFFSVLLLAYPSTFHDLNVVHLPMLSALYLVSSRRLRDKQHRNIKTSYLLFLPRHNYVACHYNTFPSLLYSSSLFYHPLNALLKINISDLRK